MRYPVLMNSHLKIEGIYDQRTLKLLKAQGLKDFGFDFSPKSFNFIQEHIFLSELVPLLGPQDSVHLHFSRSNDPMIKKVIEDLKGSNIQRDNIFLDCDEWSSAPVENGLNYYLNYCLELDSANCSGDLFKGIVFQFSFLEELHRKNILNNFISNFYTKFNHLLGDDKKIIVRIDWNENVFPSLFDYFEIDLLSFTINSKIEICYRNVDLKKLTNEMGLLKKRRVSIDNF
jgi:hypothetical protein